MICTYVPFKLIDGLFFKFRWLHSLFRRKRNVFLKNWSIPEAEIKRRRDFRSECVFTIDPLTARDLDDALSVTKEADGNYRLVRANSAGSANNINAIDLSIYRFMWLCARTLSCI